MWEHDPPELEDGSEEEGGVVFDQCPVKVRCPVCGRDIITFIEHEASWITYAAVVVLFLTLGLAAIFVAPIVYPLFKDVKHQCPKCMFNLATRSRVKLPSFKDEVMSFRFGSCVVVLARRYVVVLMCLLPIVACVYHSIKPPAAPEGIDALQRGGMTSASWTDFLEDCGRAEYQRNPIRVVNSFNHKYKNNSVHWRGTVSRVDRGLSLPYLSQPGLVFMRMQPAELHIPSVRKRKKTNDDVPELMLVYWEGEHVADTVRDIKLGEAFSFEATASEVGRLNSPHEFRLWSLTTTANASALGEPGALQAMPPEAQPQHP